MAPKKEKKAKAEGASSSKRAKKSAQDQEDKEEVHGEEEEEEPDMGKLQRNFMASLAKIKDDDPNKIAKQEALASYRALPLRSNKKHELLKTWAKDKSCQWVNTFSEKNDYIESRTQKMADGWGTKLHCWITCYIYLFILLLAYLFLFYQSGVCT